MSRLGLEEFSSVRVWVCMCVISQRMNNFRVLDHKHSVGDEVLGNLSRTLSIREHYKSVEKNSNIFFIL